MPEPGFVTIISTDTGNTADVPQSSLFQHYQAGWRLLADGDLPPVTPPGEPAPVTEAEVKAALSKPSKSAKE
jgi:hypothetical protein